MQITVNHMYAVYFTDNGQETLVRYCTNLNEFNDYLDTVDNPENYILRNTNLTQEEQSFLNNK